MRKIFYLILGMLLLNANMVFAQTEIFNSTREVTIQRNLNLLEENPSLRSESNDIIDMLDARSMDVTDVLDLIERRSDLTIISDDTIEGEVTLFLKDVNARDALMVVLDMVDLAFSENNNIIKVMTKEEFRVLYGQPFKQNIQTANIPLKHISFPVVEDTIDQMLSSEGRVLFDDYASNVIVLDTPLSIDTIQAFIEQVDVPIEKKTFILQYAAMEDVLKQIEPLVTKNLGTISTDDKQFSITISDTQLKIEKIGKLIKELDEEAKQVSVKTKILQITLSDEHETGVDWEAIVSDYQAIPFKGFINSKEEFQTEKLSLGTVSAEDYPILLEALEAVGIIENVFEGSIDAQQMGRVDITVTTNDLNLGLIEDDESGIYEDEEFRLSLNVNEKNERFVTDVQPQIFVEGSGVLKQVPRDAQLPNNGQIKVKKGETLVVGGMFKEIKVESIKKIPFLADIPFLGFAFRMQKEQLRNTEVIIFLTTEVNKKD